MQMSYDSIDFSTLFQNAIFNQDLDGELVDVTVEMFYVVCKARLRKVNWSTHIATLTASTWAFVVRPGMNFRCASRTRSKAWQVIAKRS
jgi:hypothetical protein